MRDEFDGCSRSARTGRMIPSVDHQTPPGVSLNQYRIYVRLVGEYASRWTS